MSSTNIVIRDLKVGDIVQHRETGTNYIVTANYGEHAIAERSVHIQNPAMWRRMEHVVPVRRPASASPPVAGSALRYRCEGGAGCVKPGCEFVANGKPWAEHEKMYMCPLNHWRSCRWVLMPNAGGEGREV